MIEGFSLALSTPQTSTTEVDIAALVETYAALLFRVAHAILRNPAESEDVVQDVFVRILEHRLKLPLVRDMRVWLVRIAWNLALDRRRRIRPDQMDELFAQTLIAADTPADIAFESTRRMNAVLHHMEKLSRKEREVLLLSAIEELNTAEIAQIVGRTESAVRALLFRARTHLRTRLEKGDRA